MQSHDSIVARSADVLHGNILTRIAFEDHTKALGWRIGHMSYGVPSIVNFLGHRAPYLEIGSYCSIAADVEIMFGGNHHIDFITSYPLGAAKPFVGNTPRLDFADDRHAELRIGHDVWIGRGARIMAGVTIGTGAVIGAYSVVAKSVDPYAIVAGNPARRIRSRFSDADVIALLKSEWWNLPLEDIERLQTHLLDSDVTAFIDAVKALRERAAV